MDSNIFWDMRRTMSYNRFLNFIVGNRGGGKTYGFKKMEKGSSHISGVTRRN